MRLVILTLAFSALAFAQNPNTAAYPGSIATDSTLLVASNNAVTTLASAITSSATTIPLLNSGNFIAPTAITIVGANGANELIFCPTLSGGSYTGCTRGWQGSTAAAYAAGTLVYENMISYYHNQDAAEIKAIESALGPNFTGGGISSHGANYTLAVTDNATLVILNGTSLTATLPNPPPNAQWTATVLDLNSSSLTLSPNGLTINSSSSNVTLTQYQSAKIWTDGSNYYQTSGGTSGGGLSPIASDTLLSNITGSSAVPIANSLTAIIDAVLCNSQGSILYRGASQWACLAPGTSGYIFQTQGAGLNPQWLAVTGTGNAVLANSPVLVTPNLGTPSAANLANATSLPIAGIAGLGSGVAAALGLSVSGTGSICLSSGSACTGGGGGSLTCELSGGSSFTCTALNIALGAGVLATLSNSSGTATYTLSADTSVVQTHLNAASGSDLDCNTGGSGTAFTCSIGAAITSYTQNQVFTILPNYASGANPSLNVNGIGPLTMVKNLNGVLTNIAASDLASGIPSIGIVLDSSPDRILMLPTNWTSGGGSSITLQTNGTSNSSQSLLNLQSGSPYQGLSINFSNPSGGVVQATLSGSFTGNTTGNAGTANALAASPSQCTGGQVPTGISANGNANGCFSPSGTGTVTTSGIPATNTLPLFTGSTVIGNSNVQQSGTTGAVSTAKSFSSPLTALSSSSSMTFDLSTANSFEVTLGSAVTMAVTNATQGATYTWTWIQASSGGPYQPTYPSNFFGWSNVGANANEVTQQSFLYDGSNFRAATGAQCLNCTTFRGAAFPVTVGTATQGYAVCLTGSSTYGNCTATPATNFVGVFVSGSAYAVSGHVTVALDGTQTVAHNDLVCTSSTSGGKFHDNGSSACPSNTFAGYVIADATSATTARVALLVGAQNTGSSGTGCVPSGAATNLLTDSGSGTCTSNSNAQLNSSGVFTKYAGISTTGLGVPALGWVSNVPNQSTSQSTVTLASSPSAGFYRISYYGDLNTPCTTGGNSVTFTAGWTDGSNARSLNTGSLAMGAAQSVSSYISGHWDVWIGSGNVTYSSTVTGSCASGTSSYDIHFAMERLQ